MPSLIDPLRLAGASAQRDLSLRKERRERGDRNDRHLSDEGVDDRVQMRLFQSEIDAPSRLGKNAICRDQGRSARRSKNCP